MAIRGARMVVTSEDAAAARARGRTSKPSIALFHTSFFTVAIASGTPDASGLVSPTFAPDFSRRFTTRAASAPLYGKRHVPAELAAANSYFGVELIFSSARSSASFDFANS